MDFRLELLAGGLTVFAYPVILSPKFKSDLSGFVREVFVEHNNFRTFSRENEAHPLLVKTTRYFEEQVLRKRPYLKREWCERALDEPIYYEIQPDDRIRYWIFIPELGTYLRVITLEDGETIHNAFPDRAFKL